MKLVKICAVGAFLCGPSFCNAQIQFLDNVGESKSMLVATDETRLQPAVAAELSRDPALAEAEISNQAGSNPFQRTELSPSDQAKSSNAPLANNDPNSLPVGIHHRRNVIDQIIQQGVVAEVPHTSYAPVDWPMQMHQSYNPTARVLLYSRCANGLWDNYAAEQAAYCARIQKHVAHGHQSGCGCATCSGAGCAHGTCASGNCASSGHFNRYTNCSVGCDSPPTPVAQNTPTSPAAQQPIQPYYEPTLQPVPAPVGLPTPGIVPAPIETPVLEQPLNAAVNGSAGNVARLPTITR